MEKISWKEFGGGAWFLVSSKRERRNHNGAGGNHTFYEPLISVEPPAQGSGIVALASKFIVGPQLVGAYSLLGM
jgi:hypothetical protein